MVSCGATSGGSRNASPVSYTIVDETRITLSYNLNGWSTGPNTYGGSSVNLQVNGVTVFSKNKYGTETVLNAYTQSVSSGDIVKVTLGASSSANPAISSTGAFVMASYD